MHIYRFKITTNTEEDFSMQVDIKSNQTFKEFHDAIKTYCNIKTNELSSFFICDHKWHKNQEITLLDMRVQKEDFEDEDIKPVMEQVTLSQLINDPHQRLLFVYDYINMFTFNIELINILKVSDLANYPNLVKKEGEINLTKNKSKFSLLKDDEIFKELFDVDSNDNLITNKDAIDDTIDDPDDIETDMYYGKDDAIEPD